MNRTSFMPPERPWTSSRRVLFTDFDGVLRRGQAYRTQNGIVSSHPSIQLFEFAHILAEAIAPYPELELVLSTSWVKALGFDRARDSLPLPLLRQRVKGATYHSRFYDRFAWNQIPRGEQIRRYVERHHLVKWLAIDDRDDGFDDAQSHLVHCDENLGLGDATTQQILTRSLKAEFGRR
ncbi:HAD domain-containing protein [Paraburkholderia caribensis]|uniref:HAD domain-containing protein n=1 Tax=Paraburkholderia caribensis TaxID=75105 RepID=UPI001CC73127|nr:HAD domain-containing protein [Paraburkholderia caribensis]